jgi:hypothetical protein
MKNWCVVYKVNLEMQTHQYDEYVERHEDDNVVHVYQEEIEGHQSFTVSDGAGLTEWATHELELMKKKQVLQRNAFKNQNVSWKTK